MEPKGPKINMNQLFPGKMTGKPRILVAPLDWGLGHATRCIQVIRMLLNRGADVWLAGEGAQEKLLKEEFPGLPFLPLQGYRMRYAKTAPGLVWSMLRQLPKMRRAIREEQAWLENAVQQYQLDAVISDNRYGLHHPSIPSVFITHQLLIKSGWGKWTEKILQKNNYRFINKFSRCWVPDAEGPENLAGELSHPERMPGLPVQYIGVLSRFTDKHIPERKDHLLLLLSGPEPQRSLLENKFIKEIGHYSGTATVVRGLPGQSMLIPSTNMIHFYNHLSAEELNAAMEEADLVICRSGYSSIMDAMVLRKKCVLIPTPGQTEQEYLGSSLMNKGLAVSIRQSDFTLEGALAAARNFNYRIPPATNSDPLLKAIDTLLHQVGEMALG